MPKSSPLARKKCIKKEDLLDLPLICSRQAISSHQTGNEFPDWFGKGFTLFSAFGAVIAPAL